MPLVVDPHGVEIATIRELVALDGLHVLDVGCGDGRISFQLAHEGATVLGLDPDEESIAAARAETPRQLRRRLRFEAAHAAQAELPKGEFDLAVFSWSL